MDYYENLSDVETAWLMSIDSLLMQAGLNAHAMAAGQILDRWSSGGATFRRELARRARAWRKRQEQMVVIVSKETGLCQRLARMMDTPASQPKPPEQPRTKRRPPHIRPSRQPHNSARGITDAEMVRFMKLIETEGISAVFDPGVSVTADDKVFYPPLIVLDGVTVFYDKIAPVYERQEIERPWSPHTMEPQIALAFDYALLITLKEKKWTWAVSDRYFSRLPWGHPCKATAGGRPGWVLLTGMLEGAGYIERRSGQTWKLAGLGQSAFSNLVASWRSITKI